MKTILAVSCLFVVSLANAGGLDWKKCDKEVKEYKCKGSDKEIYECLEKHDKDLSPKCQETHEQGDKLFAEKK